MLSYRSAILTANKDVALVQSTLEDVDQCLSDAVLFNKKKHLLLLPHSQSMNMQIYNVSCSPTLPVYMNTYVSLCPIGSKLPRMFTRSAQI